MSPNNDNSYLTMLNNCSIVQTKGRFSRVSPIKNDLDGNYLKIDVIGGKIKFFNSIFDVVYTKNLLYRIDPTLRYPYP